MKFWNTSSIAQIPSHRAVGAACGIFSCCVTATSTICAYAIPISRVGPSRAINTARGLKILTRRTIISYCQPERGRFVRCCRFISARKPNDIRRIFTRVSIIEKWLPAIRIVSLVVCHSFRYCVLRFVSFRIACVIYQLHFHISAGNIGCLLHVPPYDHRVFDTAAVGGRIQLRKDSNRCGKWCGRVRRQ